MSKPPLGEYPSYYTEAHRLVHDGLVGEMSILIDQGLDVNLQPEGYAEVKPSLLHIAAERGFRHMILLLRKHGAKVNAQDDLGNTPLLLAVNNSRASGAVSALLQEINGERADPNIPNFYNYTPLFVAARDSRLPIVKALVKHGARADISTYLDESARSVATDYYVNQILG